jgi:L-seryl-tRNA(Ser) seleniumtransferase
LGFTSEISLPELVQLGRERKISVMEDLGSGCLVDLTKYGLGKEPTVQEVMKTGVDVVTFSGDKLLGGPQAGIILGNKKTLDLIKINPLARALRIDKLTLAALESTLLLYLDEKKAVEEIPTLQMLTADRHRLKRRGRRLLKRLMGVDGIEAFMREDVSQVGGGSLPLQDLPTLAIAIRPSALSVNDLENNLRKGNPPILCRISREELILDLRTIFDEEIPLVAEGIGKVLASMK